jgi:phenylalanyl-tRNA synthetase beta chain
MAPRTESHTPLSRLRQILLGRDYQEVITYSFVDPELQASLLPEDEAIMLANPISSEMSAMRTGLLPGLVATVSHNLNRQQTRVRIFESGLKFLRRGNDMLQEAVLGGAICGTRAEEQWGVESARVDFFDIKGDVEAVLGLTAGELAFRPAAHPALHPGQSAEVLLDGEAIGFVGALHPAVQQKLSLAAVSQARIPAFRPLSRFPAIRRDLAIVVEQSVSRQQVEESIRMDASEILQDLILFDVYVGKGIDSGRKSLALGLTLQDNSRTLTDEEVEGFIAKVVSGLETRLGATLRV